MNTGSLAPITLEFLCRTCHDESLLKDESWSPDVRAESGTSLTRPENIRRPGLCQGASGNFQDVLGLLQDAFCNCQNVRKTSIKILRIKKIKIIV